MRTRIMRTSKLLIIMVLFLLIENVDIPTVQAATVLDGGPSPVFVHTSQPAGAVNSANRIVADTSNPTLGNITSISLKGYAAYDSSSTTDVLVNIGYFTFDSSGSSNVYQVFSDGGNSLHYSNPTIVDETIKTYAVNNPMLPQAFLQVLPSGRDTYIYVSSFTSTNAVGTEFIVNYSAPSDYETPTISGSLSLSPASFTLQTGSTQQLTATSSVSGDVTSQSNYTSSDPSIATVSSTGLVTAIAAGTATITATFNGLTATATITVSAPVTPPGGGDDGGGSSGGGTACSATL